MNKQGKYYSGTSGLTLPVPNKSLYPAEYQVKSRLYYYASLFSSIEINSSFYKLPMPKTVSKWAAEVPCNFRFTYKLWRNITHNKGLAFDSADIACFMHIINQAAEKKGCLLVQFPPSITIASRVQLEKLLQLLYDANTGGWHIAIEFRSKTWYRDDIYSLLRRYQMGVVLHDMPKSAPPMLEQEVPFVYLRFHGPGGSYRGSYPDDFLVEYAQYIQTWQEEGKAVYVYFNNTMGDAVKNLQTLNSFVANG
ncbi:hypothetical protein A0256_09810 [Mucilaginibacter sp. PAMC 26640]|nr:hypothetical protein A0256_09810 [Mucilaginibacter sp. PAMC 26640]